MEYNGNDNNYRDMNSMREQCRKNITFHDVITMKDGSMFDGIIEGVDRENFTMLVSEPVMMEEDVSYVREEFDRQRRRRPARRFRRRTFPLARLAALDLVPYPYILPFFFL